MVKYVCDSSCDILEYEGISFATTPLTISTDEKDYIDDENLDVHKMLEELASYKGKSYTACPSLECWLQCFEGGDEIYVITMTSGLSGTYNSACMARNLYLEDHPEAKIAIFDSLSTGPEMKLILDKVVALKKEGKNFEETSCEIREYMKKTRLFFAFESVHNLAQNGRINKLVASAIGALNIRLLGTASEKGEIEVINKCRGEKKVIAGFLSELDKAGYEKGPILITHIENETFARKIGEAIQEKYGKVPLTYGTSRGLCSFYLEKGGVFVACETR